MDLLTAIILGIIEGLTEFLPISSTGHLILATELLKIPSSDFIKSFGIIIQLGAILAVVSLYWKKLFTNKKVIIRVFLAFIPTAIIGFIFYSLVKDFLLSSNEVVLVALFVGGLVLIIFELWHKEEELAVGEIENISLPKAFGLGVCQALAIIPGVSRSGATIIGGLAFGLKRTTIVEFSFLLAVPTMVAASGFDLIKSSIGWSGNEIGLLLVGLVTSFLVALLAIKTFLDYIQRHNFIIFGVYRIILAVVFGLLIFYQII